MRLGPDDWKGWLPDEYQMIATIHSSNLAANLRKAVGEMLYKDGRFGNQEARNKVAEALEELAKKARNI